MNNTLSFVTLAGLPLTIELRWPFHKSTSGGDFHVLHGVVTLADGSGLHANVSIHLSEAVRELLPSIEREDVEGIVINALRKWTDKKELEFLQSTKLQPLQLSSRFLNFRSKIWRFEDATDEQLVQLLKDTLFWANGAPVTITDPINLLYTAATTERMRAAAEKLASEGLAQVHGDSMTPTAKLSQSAAHIKQRATEAYEQIKQKHAFEAAKIQH